MHQIPQNSDAARDDLMGFCPVDIGDETRAAGAVFMARIIKTLAWLHPNSSKASLSPEPAWPFKRLPVEQHLRV